MYFLWSFYPSCILMQFSSLFLFVCWLFVVFSKKSVIVFHVFTLRFFFYYSAHILFSFFVFFSYEISRKKEVSQINKRKMVTYIILEHRKHVNCNEKKFIHFHLDKCNEQTWHLRQFGSFRGAFICLCK